MTWIFNIADQVLREVVTVLQNKYVFPANAWISCEMQSEW